MKTPEALREIERFLLAQVAAEPTQNVKAYDRVLHLLDEIQAEFEQLVDALYDLGYR